MQKIPTLFKRDPENMRRVMPDVTLGCEWVLAGEGTATRKYDGTCVLLVEPESLMSLRSLWWARREVKRDKAFPPNFTAIVRDENTGKTVGWEPIEQSPFAKFHAMALTTVDDLDPGTYELCGPKVNGNRHGFDGYELLPHGADGILINPEYLTFDGLRSLMDSDETANFTLGEHAEGIVWHHPDGRMAKLKVRDFALG